jgi:molybdopterin-guanine dinucleotide biosynthesis protein A
MSLYGLVLSGGQSSRMGRDKGSLVFRGKTLREQAFQNLGKVCDLVFISLRRGQPVGEEPVIYDRVADLGPAAALLAAHAEFPKADWFIVACDFPFADLESYRYLYEQFKATTPAAGVTSYQHADETPEPLFAVWRSSALEKLKKSVAQEMTGPLHTLKQCQPRLVPPRDPQWLVNTNTPEEFEAAQRVRS